MRSSPHAILALCLVFATGRGISAADCEVPPITTSIEPKYSVYHQSAEFPYVGDDLSKVGTQVPIDEVVDWHLLAAELVFKSSNLNLLFVSDTRPVLTQLTTTQVVILNELIDAVAGPSPPNAIGDFIAKATTESIYSPLELNIYYVDRADVSGLHLRTRDGYSHNIIIIGLGFDVESLAHELGHAFSLRHVNFWTHDDLDSPVFPNGVQVEYCAEFAYWDDRCNFTTTNLMWANEPNRAALTSGQILRVACNKTSALIKNGDYQPSGAPIDCPEWSVKGNCPEAY